MGKRLTACLLALCLAAGLLCSVSAKEQEISVEIDHDRAGQRGSCHYPGQ